MLRTPALTFGVILQLRPPAGSARTVVVAWSHLSSPAKYCPWNGDCTEDRLGTARCSCPTSCDFETKPVCATDGVTYPNRCKMRVDSCRKQKRLWSRHQGNCHATPPYGHLSTGQVGAEGRQSVAGCGVPASFLESTPPSPECGLPRKQLGSAFPSAGAAAWVLGTGAPELAGPRGRIEERDAEKEEKRPTGESSLVISLWLKRDYRIAGKGPKTLLVAAVGSLQASRDGEGIQQAVKGRQRFGSGESSGLSKAVQHEDQGPKDARRQPWESAGLLLQVVHWAPADRSGRLQQNQRGGEDRSYAAVVSTDKGTTSGMGDSSDNEEVGNEAAGLEEPESHSEVEVLKMKIRLRELELEIAREQRGSGPTPRGNGWQENHGEMRHFSKLISSVLPKFPTEAEVPVWFEAAESALEGYEVPKAWWGQIIFPLVAEKIPFLSTRLAPPQHRDYEVLKGAVLEEMKLSAGEYLRRFHGAKKRAAEGWRAFATRLQSYLRCYVEARGVSTFEELVDLFTADQMKDSLSEAALKYVTLQEGGSWRKAHEIAALVVTFEEAEGENSGVKRSERKIIDTMTTGPKDRAKPLAREPTKARGCFLCGEHGHLKADCPRAENRDAAASGSQERIGLSARVSATAIVAGGHEREPIGLCCGDDAWKLLKEADRVRQQTAHAPQPDMRAKPSRVRVSEAVLAFDDQCSGKMFPKRNGPGRVRGRHRWRRRRGKDNAVVAGAPGLERSAHHRKGSAHVNEGPVLRVPNAWRLPAPCPTQTEGRRGVYRHLSTGQVGAEGRQSVAGCGVPASFLESTPPSPECGLPRKQLGSAFPSAGAAAWVLGTGAPELAGPRGRIEERDAEKEEKRPTGESSLCLQIATTTVADGAPR
ncbi:hypothetical protein HPB52_010005 [Rhipicephalus sanguineus]|uniref:CCHC-type domain-containing protein n=1 Tax=Rhipicephalus sanguineus TaxID=34632 RepID=A0A9D4PVK4_RHISA|nr:hypothetical protein HPB52_010005 [Rhipicephalus sanguineus]